MKNFLIILSLYTTLAFSQNYPDSWWQPVPESQRESWEILPQQASRESADVILSKRTELGVFSNLSRSDFVLDGQSYGSLEGFWQMMKYPESQSDPRSETVWPHDRANVSAFHGWEAKLAGDEANSIMVRLGISWISYLDQRFEYKDRAEGSTFHYELIIRATREKLNQNPPIKALLLRTAGLRLRSDHHIEASAPAAYHTPEILMTLRAEMLQSQR